MNIEDALNAIEQLPKEINTLRQSLESSKDEFMSDLNIVNKELLDSLNNVKAEAETSVGLIKVDLTKTAIDFERKITDLEIKFKDSTDASFRQISNTVANIRTESMAQIDILREDLSRKIISEVEKQITWGNLIKILFGRK